MDQPYPHILSALMSWYTDQRDRGVSTDRLPNLRDLETIAATPGVTRLMLPELPLVDEAALMPYASGVMMTVRTARQAFADLPSPPPAQQAQVLLPPAAPETTAAPAATRPPRLHRLRAEATATTPTDPVVEAGTFASYDMVHAIRPAFVLTPELQQSQAGTRIGWQAPADLDAGAAALYRVVSRDDVLPWNPDEAHLIAVTTATEVQDARPLPVAVRYLQVWVHTGPTEAAARAAQPTLLREGCQLTPPTAVECVEDQGSVVLSWILPPGLTRVELSRVAVGTLRSGGYDDAERLLCEPGQTNFQDTSCLPGEEYEYRLNSVLRDPTTLVDLLSDPVSFRLRISSAVTPVAEIRVVQRREGARTLLDLEWDHPSGSEVRIYRTVQPPVIGATLQDIGVSALPGAGLADADRQRLPVQVSAGVSGMPGVGRMHGVAWPDDLPRVHLTAVTVSGSDARVGDTATRNRTTPITSVRLVQRATWQLLTFDWPPGTVSVDVHETLPGSTLEDDPRPPSKTLSEADYRRDGGIRVELPWHGCEVHLVPVSFYDGRPVKGTPTTATYPGLILLRYRVTAPDVPAPSGRTGGGRTGGGRFGSGLFGGGRTPPPAPSPLRAVELMPLSRGPGPAQVQVTCTLVARRDRIPLSVQDCESNLGEMVVTISMAGVAGWQPVGTPLDFSAYRGGYLRLFARLDPAVGFAVALLDPALESLRPQ